MDFSTVCDADELLALARLDVEKERLDQALVKLKQALAAKPGERQADLTAELGRLYARLGLRKRAQEMFAAYLALVPEAINERFQLGLVHFESGERDQALATWNQVMAGAPLHPPAMFYSALALAQGGEVMQAAGYCQTILTKVESTNLYFDKARELMQKIEADPAFAAGRAASSAQAYKPTEH